MSTRILSSGDITADRRADYARGLAEGGDYAAAADLMTQALELAPDWAAGWFLAGDYCEKAGDQAAAKSCFGKVIALVPDDIFGAGLRLAVLAQAGMPNLPPSSYVKGLFDDYADRFDEALVKRLAYLVPGLMRDLIDRTLGSDTRFDTIIDLGCGTGLFGVEMVGRANRLEGWDLSPAMLAKAAERKIYDQLGEADLSLPSGQSGLVDTLAHHRGDLVTAADVMMYLGDLEAALDNAVTLLAPAGHLVFSVEKASGEQGFELRPSLRYAHSAAFIRANLARRGLDLLDVSEATIRMDAGEPVTGLIFIARAQA